MLGVLFWVGWNTFLALVPVAAAYAIRLLARSPGKQSHSIRQAGIVLLGLVWLAFLPNTCYLLTEWRHFLERLYGTELYARWHLLGDTNALLKLTIYTAFFSVYSAVGMACFALAVRPIHRLVAGRLRPLWAWAAPFFMLVALGVYLGLVLRFNSWELLSRPDDILDAVASALARPLLLAMVVFFGAFLWLAYVAIDIWFDGLLLRWREVRSE